MGRRLKAPSPLVEELSLAFSTHVASNCDSSSWLMSFWQGRRWPFHSCCHTEKNRHRDTFDPSNASDIAEEEEETLPALLSRTGNQDTIWPPLTSWRWRHSAWPLGILEFWSQGGCFTSLGHEPSICEITVLMKTDWDNATAQCSSRYKISSWQLLVMMLTFTIIYWAKFHFLTILITSTLSFLLLYIILEERIKQNQ
jgi:hypothetical protein